MRVGDRFGTFTSDELEAELERRRRHRESEEASFSDIIDVGVQMLVRRRGDFGKITISAPDAKGDCLIECYHEGSQHIYVRVEDLRRFMAETADRGDKKKKKKKNDIEDEFGGKEGFGDR